MAETTIKTLKLTKSIITHQGDVTTLDFAEPTYFEYSLLGEPTEWQVTKGGDPLHFLRPAVIAEYAERCVRPKDNGPLLTQLCLKDARAVNNLILDFFREPKAEAES